MSQAILTSTSQLPVFKCFIQGYIFVSPQITFIYVCTCIGNKGLV